MHFIIYNNRETASMKLCYEKKKESKRYKIDNKLNNIINDFFKDSNLKDKKNKKLNKMFDDFDKF